MPTNLNSTSTTVGIAEAGAAEIERWLKQPDPIVFRDRRRDARSRRRSTSCRPSECPQHRIMSLTGNIRTGQLGRLLQRHLQHGGRHRGTAFPDAAARSRFVGEEGGIRKVSCKRP